MPHSRHRSWIEIQKKLAGFHHPSMNPEHDVGWIPNADVIEHADGILVRLELAGVDHESLSIIAANSALIITGIRANPHAGGTAQGYRFRQMEIEYGSFERVLPLPYPVDQHIARAMYTGGILEIHLGKARSSQRKKTVIHIQW